MTLEQTIQDAIEEAKCLQMGVEKYDKDYLLYIAQKLSGAPFSFVQMVYEREAA